jgi:hypothetical protein
LKLRELFIACQPLPAIAFVINGAPFQQFECLNLTASFSANDISPDAVLFLYNHDAIFSRIYHLISGSEPYTPSVFGDTEMMAPLHISDAWWEYLMFGPLSLFIL